MGATLHRFASLVKGVVSHEGSASGARTVRLDGGSPLRSLSGLMRYDDVVLASLHAVEATHRVRTADLEAQLSAHLPRLGLLPGTLEALSGIVARRFWDADFAPSDMLCSAGSLAMSGYVNLKGRLVTVDPFTLKHLPIPEQNARVAHHFVMVANVEALLTLRRV